MLLVLLALSTFLELTFCSPSPGCILAPVLVNKLGVKRVLILGSLGWSIYTAALCASSSRSSSFRRALRSHAALADQNNRYGTEWFVILGAVICAFPPSRRRREGRS